MHTCCYSNTMVMLMHDRILVSNTQYLTESKLKRGIESPTINGHNLLLVDRQISIRSIDIFYYSENCIHTIYNQVNRYKI